ncbi:MULTISPECIES: molybdopterin cofactor-binding domain-containing protein [unclassified Rhodococcus (in: high G+C Gram-positive bacteria)]|uniref:molybdopterin cofactor-binding domain-containing protein n=1 Tax=unclassified Rhodococcus (in: high G+C Gram-positive bacteria) TaxID=192944 RepID=UPI00254A4314|nr:MULTISPECIES: molybdopterin cofactor-binding domain-containing protein [unclassified Rhodococcus (in: high G+C Gram-positive bacteria)]MDQ1180014.1 xanthine dehydrogenase D subunit [Rhodococcus sp. SORGH_AS_0301]
MSAPGRTRPGAFPAPVDAPGLGRVGDSPLRPDGTLKVKGEFAYSSDLFIDGMLHGATLRSPHPRARIVSVDISAALALPGVEAVLTHEDVPGRPCFGLDGTWDQPVLAFGEVRHEGEPIVLVAADHPETARRAMERIEVVYEVLEPLCDARRAALDPTYPKVQERGGIARHQPVRVGDVAAARARADVIVSSAFSVGIQDQAFLGPESGLAVPGDDGGVDLYVATQWMHNDLEQIGPCLGLPKEKIRMTLSGVGGAFGGREDLSMQIHAAMLAMYTGKPVRMVYNRYESFFGHVHRHPAQMHYEYGATSDGRLLFADVEIILDGGAYTSATLNVVGNAASLGVGPYVIPNIEIDAYGVYTNNPPCGAMRGFGAVQACFAYESMMDQLAEACGLSPVEVRRVNAVAQGSLLATGQVIEAPAPLAEMLLRAEAMPMPAPLDTSDIRNLPGGASQTTHGEGVVRGVGYGVGLKNICFSENYDDYSTARVRLEVIGGEVTALVHTAAAEVGQGLVTLEAQIARTELGVSRVTIHPADTTVGNSGSSSASRQSYMTGGAVKAACEAVREAVFVLAGLHLGRAATDLTLDGGKVVSRTDGVLATIEDVLGDRVVEQTREFHHRPTTGMDPVTGQGASHTQLALCVHRAVVDVDVELGLVKVVEMAAVQDVGRILNRLSLEGQIHGGSAQGLGLALMEEIVVVDGLVKNPSFTDYLIPTILDMPPMKLDILENPDPLAPYGLRGAGEPPTLSSTPAVVAAVRDATGLALTRVPIRPEHITDPGRP